MNFSAKTVWTSIKAARSDGLLYALAAALFFSLPMGTSPPLLCAGALALVWVCSGKVFHLWDTCLRRPWFWPVALLIVLPWVGLLYTLDQAGLGMKFAGKTHYWIYAMACASLPLALISPLYILQTFLAGLGVNALVAILQILGLFPRMSDLAYGMGLGYGTLSIYLILAMLMTSYFFRETNNRKSRLLLGLLLVLYFFHFVTLEARVGYLTFLLVSPLLAYNLLRSIKPWAMALVSIALVAGMLLSPVVRQRVDLSIQQLKHHMTADDSSSWGREYTVHQDRFYMWRGAVKIFLEHPLLGAGTGAYQSVLKDMGKPEWPEIAHPHNNILFMAVSFGLVGVLVLLWFFGEMFRNGWRERDTPLGFFILSTALVLFAGGLADTTIRDAGSLILLAAVTGLQNGLTRTGGKDQYP